MDYFDNYKSERYHDANLIALVEYLSSKGKTSLISDGFILEMPDIGQYRAGQTKKDYDVHLDFEKAAICIETKVDSCEGEYDDPLPYQTQRIYNKYKDEYSKKTFFRYVTYGASEFYIKRTENKSFSVGPYSRDFKLIPLSNIIRMIEDSGVLKESQYPELKEWHFYLKYEHGKRQNYMEMLFKISEFRKLYIGTSGLTDWPNNRVNICVPEIVLFFYSKIAQEWNASEYRKNLGGVCVYPVGRNGKVNDAILNFKELWDKSDFTLNGLIESTNAIYFEFNEDFNLHLKCIANSETDTKINAIHQFIQNHEKELSLAGKYNSTHERYKQGTYVLYEWDLNILDNITDIAAVIQTIAEVIGTAILVIK